MKRLRNVLANVLAFVGTWAAAKSERLSICMVAGCRGSQGCSHCDKCESCCNADLGYEPVFPRPKLIRYYFLPRTRRRLEAMRRLGAGFRVRPWYRWFSDDNPNPVTWPYAWWLTFRALFFLAIIICTFGYVGVVISEAFL